MMDITEYMVIIEWIAVATGLLLLIMTIISDHKSHIIIKD